MADFIERMHLKGKVQEDIYFAELDRKLIAALHEKQNTKHDSDTDHINDQDNAEFTVQK